MVKKKMIVALIAVCALFLFVWHKVPTIPDNWTKQTLYLWILNCFHSQSKSAKAKILLVDDDSGNGIFSIKKICNELNIKATFAVIPTLMTQEIIDSLKDWQKQNYGIALHGYNHSDWGNWRYKDIINDINKCEHYMEVNGICIEKIKYVVAPKGCNSHAVRKAIKNKGYQFITGAIIMNPDSEVFQLGRIFINKKTDLREIQRILQKAKKNKLFVILGTHSSRPEEFSEEKTKAVLQMAINMGFEYQH